MSKKKTVLFLVMLLSIILVIAWPTIIGILSRSSISDSPGDGHKSDLIFPNSENLSFIEIKNQILAINKQEYSLDSYNRIKANIDSKFTSQLITDKSDINSLYLNLSLGFSVKWIEACNSFMKKPCDNFVVLNNYKEDIKAVNIPSGYSVSDDIIATQRRIDELLVVFDVTKRTSDYIKKGDIYPDEHKNLLNSLNLYTKHQCAMVAQEAIKSLKELNTFTTTKIDVEINQAISSTPDSSLYFKLVNKVNEYYKNGVINLDSYKEKNLGKLDNWYYPEKINSKN